MSRKTKDEHYCEIVEYTEKTPFRVILKTKREEILEHWHSELEIVYTLKGNSVHYIDGKRHCAVPGSLFVTNSESIHKIFTDSQPEDGEEVFAVVLLVRYEFVEKLAENMREKYFMTEVHSDSGQIHRIMTDMLELEKRKQEEGEFVWLKQTGLLFELFYYLCRDALVMRDSVLPINNQKNLERLRGIMTYVKEHYQEPITQKEVADRFYFTKEYFARFFKKNTGMTFGGYLNKYRVYRAAEEILNTDRSMLDIAVNCGFSDSRGLIRAFHSVYGTTPLQYRKMKGQCNLR